MEILYENVNTMKISKICLKKAVLVGRCNVGKSTTFNALIKNRKAITSNIPGTTINSNQMAILYKNESFNIIDTAGYNPDHRNELLIKILQQLKVTIATADLILFVVDGKQGIHPLDTKFLIELRKYKKNIILVINKIDTDAEEIKKYEFYRLGLSNVLTISSAHKRHLDNLLDMIYSFFKTNKTYLQRSLTQQKVLKMVIVGKSNVGKSSFINAMVNEEISLSYNGLYTTRDAVEVKLYDNTNYQFSIIDTAGIPHDNKTKYNIQYLTMISTKHAIDMANVIILMMSALDGIGDTELKIARILLKYNKPIIIAINKWDLILHNEKPLRAKLLLQQILTKLKFIKWAENVLFISVKTKYHLYEVIYKAKHLITQYSRYFSEEELNKFLFSAINEKNCILHGKFLIIKKCVQVSSAPPTFIFFVNNVKFVHFSYKRFLNNFLRKKFNLNNIPIVCVFKNV
ncbi:MAG: ribosome biogenesis GTPase Der [Endomicrobium sp.]|jgi:GTP-binding protein|nr:ribosome biogenesis GTPase Der [Endomicrobium sp.]